MSEATDLAIQNKGSVKEEFLLDMNLKDNHTEIATKKFIDEIEAMYQKWTKLPANKNKPRKLAPWPKFIHSATFSSISTSFWLTGIFFVLAETMTIVYNYMLIYIIRYL